MNKLKSNARILLIIIVAAFVIVPVVSILLSRTIGIHEGMSDYDMTDKNVSMDRINMAGVGFTNKNDDSATGGTEDYLYCIGGDIECEDSTDTLVEDTEGATYDDVNGNSHKSYSASCESGSSAVCTNNYVSTTSDNSVTFVDSNGTQTSLYGPTDTLFSGFLGPYNYIPLKIEDNYYIFTIVPMETFLLRQIQHAICMVIVRLQMLQTRHHHRLRLRHLSRLNSQVQVVKY